LSSGLLLALLGFTPIGVAAMMLGQTLRGVVPVQSGVLNELAFVILVGAFGSMVVLLCLLPLRTWRIEGTTIIVGWLGMFETSIDTRNIRSFGKLLVGGSLKHGIRPYSILCFERNDGRRYDFSSPLFKNNNELEQFLASQGRCDCCVCASLNRGKLFSDRACSLMIRASNAEQASRRFP
jgi:hypothetical protein